MSTLIHALINNKRIEARITMLLYVLIGWTAVLTAWISVAPESFHDVTWKQWVLLFVSSVGNVCTSIKSTMSKSWQAGKPLVDETKTQSA